jgi:2',3'-cyclic-nucleotide 2'-phosphodiesterase (5'-nucleotidase family)
MPLFALLAGLALAPADTVRLVVVATTDVKGQVTDWDYLRNTPAAGGLARVATVIDSLRIRYPNQLVVVDAGGALAGNPLATFYGSEVTRDPHPIVEAMNLVGYDAATPGDHDFDFGGHRFRLAIGGANFQWVSANLKVLPSGTLALAPFVVLQRNGVRVAIAGFTTPGAMVWNGPRLSGRYRLDRIESAAGRVLRDMREASDFMIVLAHSGLSGPSSYDTTGIGGENVAATLSSGSVRPDLVVLGHTGQELVDSVIAGVHYVQPRPEAQSLAVMHITMVSRNGRFALAGMTVERILLQEVRPAARVLRRLAEPHTAVLRWVSTVVGDARARFSLAAARVEDTPLMRFFHEAQRRATGADLSAAPVVDVRAEIEPGEVTLGELLRLYPYEYGLRSVRISGAALKAYLEQCARYFFVDSAGRVFTNRFVPADRYDVVGGASYVIDLSQPMGARITKLEVRGRTVQPTDSFTLALGDNRQSGHGNFSMLSQAPVVFDRELTVRQALLTELNRRKSLRLEDLGGVDWMLAPAGLARKARALFIKENLAERVTDSTPAPEPVSALVLTPTLAERLAQDSAERARDRVASKAAVVVATLRLPAEMGPDAGLPRLLADAYRNELRADLAVILSEEATARLPAKGLTATEIEAAASGDASLLTIRMSGADLQELFENALAPGTPCCEFAGVRIEYDPKAKPWERVKEARLSSTGKSLERKRTYVLALSTRLLSGDEFPLGSSGCRPVKGCRTPGALSRWSVEQSSRKPAEVLSEYLRHLPQPVSPPEDARLVPNR